jgi:hypothetical protein
MSASTNTSTRGIRRLNAIRLRDAMLAAEIQTPELSRLVNVSLPYAYSVRNGLVPSSAVRRRVAEVLKVDESVLWPFEVDDAPETEAAQ